MNHLTLVVKIVILLNTANIISTYPRSRDNFQFANYNEVAETRNNYVTSENHFVTVPSLRILPPDRPNIYNNGLNSNNQQFDPLDSHRQIFPITTKFPPNHVPETQTFENQFTDKWKNDVMTHTHTDQSRLEQLKKEARLSLAEWGNYNIREPEGPGTYAWGYDIEDPTSGNVQFRSEEKHRNGSVTGSYGYLEPDGNVHVVHYIADVRGYRATVENSKYKTPHKTSPNSPSFESFENQISPQFAAALESQQLLDANGRPKGNVLDRYNRPINTQPQPQQQQFNSQTLDNKNLGQYNFYYVPRTGAYSS